MRNDTMLVRMPGGDVVRRPVAARSYGDLLDGGKVLLQEEPKLNADETAVWTFGSPIPLIIKVR